MIIYKLVHENGMTESQDFLFIQEQKAAYGGFIEAIDRTFKITNDTQNTIYSTPDDRDEAMVILRTETFQGFEINALIDPQPSGLND